VKNAKDELRIKTGQQIAAKIGSEKRSFFRTLRQTTVSCLKRSFGGLKYPFRKTKFDLCEAGE